MKKSALTIVTLGLASSVAVGLAPQAALASEPSAPAVEQVAMIQTSPSTLQGFEKCVTQADIPTPVETAVGSHLGPGISETVTAQLRKQLNEGLVSQGRNALPESVTALRYLEDGSIVAVDSTGNAVHQISGAYTELGSKSSQMQARAWLHPEVKRIIGACLGFGGAGGMGFEQLVRWLGNPKNAVKFVIRRIGLVGAISCVGGIIWEYI